MNKYHSPFWTIVRKEVSDHVRSWRFLILIGIIALTCMGSLRPNQHRSSDKTQ